MKLARPTHQLSVAQRHEIWRRNYWRGMGAALLAHVLVFLLWKAGPDLVSPFSAAGPDNDSDRAAAGGGLRAIQVQLREARPIPRPAEPIITFEPEDLLEIEEEPVEEFADLLGEAPVVELGEGEGDLVGPGLETGDGQGDGGTAAEGLNRLNPPIPRGMIIPPTNRRLRGREVEVWVWVDVNGRVVPDSTYLVPPTSDRKFNDQLLSEAAEWVFRPATKDGQAVAAWFPYRISM